MAQKKTYRLLTLAVMAMVLTALFALTTFAADITGGFGTIILPDDGNAYEAASVTINKTGDGANIDEENIIDLSTDNEKLAGLYAVRVKNGEWNDEYVYVYGDAVERTKLGNWAPNASNKLLPTAELGTEWKPGTWISAANHFITDAWASTANYYPLTANYIATVARARELYVVEHPYDVAQKELTSASYGLPVKAIQDFYNQHYNYEDIPRVDDENNPVIDEATGNQIVDRVYGELKETSKGRAAELRKIIADEYRLRGFKYAFEPGEIVHARDLIEFPITVRSEQYCVYPQVAKAQVIFYVMDKYGNIHDCTWTSDLMKYGYQTELLDTVISVQALDGLYKDGWVVGVEVKPYGIVEDDSVVNFVASGGLLDSQAYYKFYFNKYRVSYPAPEGLSYDGKKITGLDAETAYIFAPVGVQGLEDDRAIKVSGVSEYTIPADKIGLWAMAYDVSGNFAKLGYTVYLRGSYADRAAFGDYWEAGDKYAHNGNAVGEARYGKIKTATGTNWYREHFSGSNSWYSQYWGANGVSSDTHLEAGKNNPFANATTEAEKEATFSAIRNQLNPIYIQYAMADNEVIPVSEVNEYVFATARNQGSFVYTDNVIKFVAYIADERGTVLQYDCLLPAQDLGSRKTHTVNFESTAGWSKALPKDGYLVGFRIYPYYGFNDYNKFNSPYYQHSQRITVEFCSYSIDVPQADKPVGVEFNDGVFSGLKDGYAIAPYTILGADLEKTVTSDKFVDGTYTLPEGSVGLYGVYTAQTSEYLASDPVIFYANSTYSAKQKLGTFVDAEGNALTKPTSNKVSAKTLEWTPGVFLGAATNTVDSTTYAFLSNWVNYIGVKGDTYKAATDEEKEEYAKTIISNLEKYFSLRYAYAPDEILPVSELNTLRFSAVFQQGSYHFYNVKPKCEIFVMDENGEVSVHTWIGSNHDIKPAITASQAVDVQSIETLPDTGWVVGFKYYYAGEVDMEDISPTGNVTSSDHQSAYVYFYYGENSYSVKKPKLDAPTGIEVEGTTFKNLNGDKTYSVAPYTLVGSSDDVKTITGVEEYDVLNDFDNPAGLYAIYYASTSVDYADSDPVLVYVKGDYEARVDIFETYDNSDFENILNTEYNNDGFVKGYVTGNQQFYNKGTNNVDLANYYGTTAENFLSWTLLSNFSDAATDEEKESAFEVIKEKAAVRRYHYAYAETEIVPVNEVVKFKYGFNAAALHAKLRITHFNLNNVTSRYDAHVMNADGTVETYTYTTTGLDIGINNNAFITVDFIDDSKWDKPLPNTGYLVGFTIHPFIDIGTADDLEFEYNGTDYTTEQLKADNVREIIYFGHGADYYTLIDNLLIPVVEKNNYIPNWDQSQTTRFTNEFNLVNYSDMFEYEYAYGDDDVTVPTEGWTALDSSIIKSTKNSKYIWVKRLAGGGFEAAAAASDLPSEAVAVEGIQLVLGGNIGAKVVFNYNTDIVASGHVYVNPDTPSTAAGLGTAKEYQFVLDGEGMGYAIVPFLPKEAEALVYENEIIYYTVDDIRVNMSNVGGNISVAKTVEAYQNNADKYADVIDLVNALETYYKAAADYFDGVAADENTVALADLSTEELADLASKRARRRAEADDIADTLGLSFHSTSLLLEDNTTIRHYFKVTGSEASTNKQVEEALALYKVEGGSELALATSTGDAKYVYTDVAGIASNALSTPSDVTVMFDDVAAGDASITVTFSALDYVDLCINDADVELQNLVKALYRYSVESDNYNA